MKPFPSALKWLVPVLFVLGGFAAAMGLFYQRAGEPLAYTSLRGEQVTIHHNGLYYFDTVSSAAQMQGNDLITLVLGLPLLAVGLVLSLKGSLRGRLLLTGTIGFFLYTYISMSMLTAYNMLFLVYVILMTASLYAFILAMMSFDLKTLPGWFSERLPRRLISICMLLPGLFLTVAWLGRVIPTLTLDTVALENTTTLVIQAMDLGLVAPLSILAAILMWKGSAWGYLLGSVFLMKSITMGLAVSTMSVNMALSGVPDSLGIMIPFITITLITLGMAGILLKNIRQPA